MVPDRRWLVNILSIFIKIGCMYLTWFIYFWSIADFRRFYLIYPTALQIKHSKLAGNTLLEMFAFFSQHSNRLSI